MDEVDKPGTDPEVTSVPAEAFAAEVGERGRVTSAVFEAHIEVDDGQIVEALL